MYDDPYGDRYYPEEQGYSPGPSRRRPIWPVAVILVLVAAAGSVALFWGSDDGRDMGEFCRAARRVAGVDRPDASLPSEEAPPAVRRAAARLILLHERLEQTAPSEVQADVAQMIDGYRQAVRSPSVSQLYAVEESEAGQRVARAAESECREPQAG